jgi:Raf kinase inhibitor-like YbhB/YbcL family protein
MSAKNRNIILTIIVLVLLLIGISVWKSNNKNSGNSNAIYGSNSGNSSNNSGQSNYSPAQNLPTSPAAPQSYNPFIKTKNMVLSSTAFNNNAAIPSIYTCDGQSINPPLTIFGTPAATKSLALTLHDPDAPLAGGFTHWVMFNFDATTKTIKQNSVPRNAVQGKNGAGTNMYVGPCPPSGVHHYEFRIYALDSVLVLDSAATKTDLDRAMQGHVLDDALLIGTYQKKAAAAPSASVPTK